MSPTSTSPTPTVRHVDLQPDLPPGQRPAGRCVVLPGRTYTPDGPLLLLAAQVALAHSWSVRQVWWDRPRLDTDAAEVAWVADRLDEALDDPGVGRVLVVAKSLGTLAAARAAERGLDAVWLTPLLTEPDLLAPLATYPARQLVVVGESDPFLDRDALATLPGEHLLVPGDHGLLLPGDPIGSVAVLDTVVRALDAWVAALTGGSGAGGPAGTR